MRINSFLAATLIVSGITASTLICSRNVAAQGAAEAPATAAANNGFAPLTQEVEGVKVTILNARWVPLSEVKFTDNRPGYDPPHAFLAIDYRFEAPGMEAGGRGRRIPPGPAVDLIAPNGWRLRGDYLGQPQDGVYTKVWKSFYGVDPRWKDVKLEFIWQDPKSPLDGRGHMRETVEWKDIALPAGIDQPTTLNLTQTTPLGTRLRLESAVINNS
jgi:hypothetical protein